MHKETSPKHCQLALKHGIHVETSKMQKHLDGWKWRHRIMPRKSKVPWGSIVMLSNLILETRAFESKYIVSRTWMQKLNYIL